VEVQLHTFLTLALNGGEQSASCLSHFTLSVTAPSTHWRGWAGPRASLDTVVKRQKSHNWPHQELNPSLYTV